jgi:hypothetical protein
MTEVLSISNMLHVLRERSRRNYYKHRKKYLAYKKYYYREHKLENKAYGRKRYEQRKAMHKCVKCGANLGALSTVQCSSCLAKMKVDYVKNRKLNIQRATERKSRINGTSGVKRLGICSWCGKKIFTIRHHIVLREAGGSDDSLNLIELCRKHHLEYARLTFKLMCEKLFNMYGEEHLREWIKSQISKLIASGYIEESS